MIKLVLVVKRTDMNRRPCVVVVSKDNRYMSGQELSATKERKNLTTT